MKAGSIILVSGLNQNFSLWCEVVDYKDQHFTVRPLNKAESQELAQIAPTQIHGIYLAEGERLLFEPKAFAVTKEETGP